MAVRRKLTSAEHLTNHEREMLARREHAICRGVANHGDGERVSEAGRLCTDTHSIRRSLSLLRRRFERHNLAGGARSTKLPGEPEGSIGGTVAAWAAAAEPLDHLC